MTLRERIADWISGGELSNLIHDVRTLRRSLIAAEGVADRYEDDLYAILTETDRDPSSPSVKRIARIAKEALE